MYINSLNTTRLKFTLSNNYHRQIIYMYYNYTSK